MRRAVTLCVLASFLLFTGCVELMQVYTLNPNGSGKVELDTITPANQQFGTDTQPKKPEEVIKEAIQERLDEGKGIEAWSNITCEMTKEGKIRFRGTAYFSNINKLNSGDDSTGNLRWTKEGDAMLLKMEKENAEGDDQPEEALTDAQVEEKLKQEKMQYQQMKPMMAAMFGGMKVQISAKLPGKIVESNIFTVDGQTATLTITGKQVIDAMEKINADDKLLRAKIKAGSKGEDDFMFEHIFGKTGPMMAKVTGATEQLFDYDEEVAKAKAGEEAMFKKLGVTKPGKSE